MTPRKTHFRTAALRTLLALMLAGVVSGCLPVGIRGQNLYTAAAAIPIAP